MAYVIFQIKVPTVHKWIYITFILLREKHVIVMGDILEKGD